MKKYIFEQIGILQDTDDKRKLPCELKFICDLFLILLKCFSLLYGFLIGIRNIFFDKGIFRVERLDCKVISIGNITAGGTGKTPAVISLARYFVESGKGVSILLRGFKGKHEGTSSIVSDSSGIRVSADSAGDEAIVIAKAVPEASVITGKDRINSGSIALREFSPDVIILDDAFQHRKIHRDIDILVIDFMKPLGNEWMLPGGVLRESPRNIKRADIVIFSRVDDDIRRENFVSPLGGLLKMLKKYSAASHVLKEIIGYPENDKVSFQEAKKREFLAFSGIGKPESFEVMLKNMGIPVVDHIVFKDHQVYKKVCHEKIINRAKELNLTDLITTEKDIVKIDSDYLKGLRLFYLKIDFEFKNGFPGWKELLA